MSKNSKWIEIFADQRLNLFKSEKETSVLLIWIDKNLNWLKKIVHYYEDGKFPKFHYFDRFSLNKKLVIRKLSTNKGFYTILRSTNTRFYCTHITSK